MARRTIDHAANIVSAYLGNHSIKPDQIPSLIASVHAALGGLGKPASTTLPAVMKPAVAIRKSIQPDTVTCLNCGHTGQTLKRHLMIAHGLSVAEYRVRWGLDRNFPVVAPNYTKKRSTLAKQIGLGSAHRNSAALGTATKKAR